jgi:sugar phosphate isomerase/epimerase
MCKIGVMVESFRRGLRGGVEAAATLGVQGIQFYATGGDSHFLRLRGAALKEFKAFLRDMNLDVAAVCGDFGGFGFQIESGNRQRIEDSKRVLELALELNCPVVTTHIGVIPPDPAHPRYRVMARACVELGRAAHAMGGVFAIETGPEPACVLRSFIDRLELPGGIGVNFDPANLVMVCREDIPSAVQLLMPYIVHTHAKDGINLKPVNAEQLYASFAGGGDPSFHAGEYIRETPLGEGDVPFPAYLALLYGGGFTGSLTIEREAGPDPWRDIELAVRFLQHACVDIKSGDGA